MLTDDSSKSKTKKEVSMRKAYATSYKAIQSNSNKMLPTSPYKDLLTTSKPQMHTVSFSSNI